MNTDTLSTGSLRSQFNELKHAFEDTPYLPIEQRLALLKKLRANIVTLEQDLIAAVSKDFGYRTAFDTLVGDILPTMQGLAHIIKKLPRSTVFLAYVFNFNIEDQLLFRAGTKNRQCI